MFDNPKKELERLQEQLLAAEAHDPADDFEDEIFDQSHEDDLLDDDLYAVLYDDQEISRRCTKLAVESEEYEMESDRYVPAPKKKGIGGLLFLAFLELVLAALLIAWWQGWLG